MKWKRVREGFNLVTGSPHHYGRILRAQSEQGTLWVYDAHSGVVPTEGWSWRLCDAKAAVIKHLTRQP